MTKVTLNNIPELTEDQLTTLSEWCRNELHVSPEHSDFEFRFSPVYVLEYKYKIHDENGWDDAEISQSVHRWVSTFKMIWDELNKDE